MIIRTSTVLSVASLIGAFAGAPGAAGEWATKEEAIALVKRAVVTITERGPEKAYAEITRRFHDRDLYITVINLDGVRFTPESGHKVVTNACPLSACGQSFTESPTV